MASSKKTEREAREARDRARRYAARQQVHAGQLQRRRRDNIIAVAAVLVVATLATVAQVFYFSAGPGAPTAEPTPTSTPTVEPTTPPGANVGDVPDPSVAEGREWSGTLQLNGMDFGITLDGAAAPQAVSSFIVSAQNGYYLDKTCHRLVQSDTAGLIQCGSFDGQGGTDTSYSFGPLENTSPDGVLYPAGTIAMARQQGNGSSMGSQFFIVYDTSSIPSDQAGGYTVFGQVTSGLDVVKAIADAGTATGSSDGSPVSDVIIEGVNIQ